MLRELPPTYMHKAAFAALFDHTLLKPEATSEQIRTLCREARTYGFKGVCINPCYVALAARELARSAQLTMAVVGFPLGASRTDIKIDEALRAINDGAGELDMVINAGFYLSSADKTAARHDIAGVVRAAGKIPVKVILETALLTPPEIQELSRWCAEAGAAFVKTSTGFGSRGASVEDIASMRAGILAATPKPVRPVEIKASGGIRTLQAAVSMVAAGATRIGSSATVKILSDFEVALTAK